VRPVDLQRRPLRQVLELRVPRIRCLAVQGLVRL
jgi:hypothetical protein